MKSNREKVKEATVNPKSVLMKSNHRENSLKSFRRVSMIHWARRYPLIGFLVLGYGIPWIGWSIRALVFKDQPLNRGDWPLGSWALYYTGCGLLISAFVISSITKGRAGVRDLLKRCVRWKVSPFWWFYALLMPILLGLISSVIIAAASSINLGSFEPWQIWRLITPAVLFIFTIGPLCEEAGWRGFLLPHLLEKHGALTASLVIGFIWTMWHFPLSFMPNFYQQFHSPIGFASYLIVVSCFSIHFSAIYLNTGGSVLLAMIIHWTINATNNIVNGMFPEATAEVWRQVGTVPWGRLVNLGLWLAATIVLVIVLGPRLRRSKCITEPGTV